MLASETTQVRGDIPSVSLTTVLLVRGPGFGSVAEQKRKLVPVLSKSSTRTVFENESHST